MSEGSPEDNGSRARRRRFQAAAGLRWLAARVDEHADDAVSESPERGSSPPSDDDQPGPTGGA